jgi:hypothetical protein
MAQCAPGSETGQSGSDEAYVARPQQRRPRNISHYVLLLWQQGLRETVPVIETDSLLVKCPRCGAWPMAASLPKASAARQEIRFRCPECRCQEEGHLLSAGNVHALAQHRAQPQGR